MLFPTLMNSVETILSTIKFYARNIANALNHELLSFNLYSVATNLHECT